MIATVILAAATAHLPSPISGDFDHDGLRDRAEVIRQTDGMVAFNV